MGMNEKQTESRSLTQERIEQLMEGARDPQGHPGWTPTNGEVQELCRLALSSEIAPPTAEEIAAYRDIFRAEMDKRMDTNHPSASPSTEAHTIALRNFVEKRNAANRR